MRSLAATVAILGGFRKRVRHIMSDSPISRGRRRSGSTSTRFKPSLPVGAETDRPRPAGPGEIAAGAAIGIVAIALVALIWIVTGRAVQDQGNEVRERAETALVGQAATIAETISHEMQMIEQSLIIIQAAWKLDSDSVDLAKWQQKMPALTAVADDLFISDENHIVRQDILPQAVGQGVSAAYVTFPHGILESFESDGTPAKDSFKAHRAGGSPVDARHSLIYLVRELDHPKDWHVGASYRSTEITKLFAQASLGFNPVLALVETRKGIVQAVVGPSARRPKLDLSDTPLFAMMTRSGTGTWLGPTGIDDVERLHAFHRVGDRDLIVVIAANWAEVMAPATSLAVATRTLAAAATVLVLAIGGLMLWELYATGGRRYRERQYDRSKGELERLQSDEAVNAMRAQLNAARLQTIVANASDGFAVFDSAQRLMRWNFAFSRGIGIGLRQEMPLDSVLRDHMALHSPAGTESEAEVARCAIALLTGDATGIAVHGPGGEALVLRGLPIEQGGFVLVLNGFAKWHPTPVSALQPAAAEDAPPPLTAAPIEW
jgi:PAS domain-containing protein